MKNHRLAFDSIENFNNENPGLKCSSKFFKTNARILTFYLNILRFFGLSLCLEFIGDVLHRIQRARLSKFVILKTYYRAITIER